MSAVKSPASAGRGPIVPQYSIKRSRRRGAAIVVVLLFTLVASTLIMGVGTNAAMHQQRATVDLQYAKALDIAEAGINFELRKISNSANSADQTATAYSLGGGTFSVRVVQRNSDGTETSPWSPPQNMYVYSTGTINGVSRTIKSACKGFNDRHHY